jgi:hypothetical protein
VDVLPDPGRAPRRTADAAREAALAEEGDAPSSAEEADEHVRRALALAELSRLVAEQD